MNRYTQLPVAMYNPMSFQELAFAPSYLRDRHDAAQGQLGALTEAANQYNVLDEFGEAASQIVNPLQKNIEQLGTRLATEGVNASRAIPEAMKLKGQYSQLFSPQGAIGQLQNRTLQYQKAAQQIKEQFKEAPELANFFINKLNAGEAKVGPDGKLQLGEMQTPGYVRDIPQEKILDRLNNAVKGLSPSDLQGLGLQSTMRLGSFDELAVLASKSGVTGQRALQLMDSLLSPEERASIIQRGQLQGLNPEESLNTFKQRMAGIALANANVKTDYKTVNVKDDLRLHMAKKQVDEDLKVPFVTPGGVISDNVVNPYSKLEIKNNKINPSPYSSLVEGSDILMFADLLSGGKLSEADKQKAIEYNKVMNDFKILKNSNPELAKLSDDKALEKVNAYYEKLNKSYGMATKSGIANMDKLASHIIGSAPNSRVWGNEGADTTFDEAIKDLGFTSYEDFSKKGATYFQGYRKMGPSGTPVYEFTVKNNDGQSKSMFVEADVAVQQLSSNSTRLNQLILGGKTSSENVEQSMVETPYGYFPSLRVDINPVATSDEPYTINFNSSNVNSSSLEKVLLPLIKGKTKEQAKQIIKKAGVSEDAFEITTLNQYNQMENNKINKLKY